MQIKPPDLRPHFPRPLASLPEGLVQHLGQPGLPHFDLSENQLATRSLGWLAAHMPFVDRFTGQVKGHRPAALERLGKVLESEAPEWLPVRELSAEELATDPDGLAQLGHLLDSHQTAMTEAISALVGYPVRGRVKTAANILDKLDRWQGPLRQLDDLTRGRIDLPTLERPQIALMLRQLQEGLEPLGMRVEVRYDGTMAPSPSKLAHYGAYRGRVHFLIHSARQGVPYELQVGPRALTRFLETPFTLEGLDRPLTMHDAVYKGISRLQQDKVALRLLGNGDLLRGKTILDGAIAEYNRLMGEALDEDKSFHFGDRTQSLRDQLDAIFRVLARHPEHLPPGLDPSPAA